jgi:hypothetical protein
MIEFRDGQQIVGDDDAEAIDAWRRIHWIIENGVIGGRDVFKGRILEHARAVYGGSALNLVTGESPDEAFLDALDEAGCLVVIRK